jgi:hypothetical protein
VSTDAQEETADAPGRQNGNKGPRQQTAAISEEANGTDTGKLWNPEAIGRRRNEDDPPYKSDTAQGTQASETRRRRYCTENSEGTNVQEETIYFKEVQGLSALLATCFHAGILLGLFYPEDGGDMFLRNVG